MRRVVFLTFCAILSFGVTNSTAQGVSAPPSMPLPESAPVSDGIYWTLWMVRDPTNYDSVILESYLSNSSRRLFTFEIRDEAVKPQLILTLPSGSTITKHLVHGPGLKKLSISRDPRPGKSFHSFSADLRGYFGKLNPGQYHVRVVWPVAGYAIEDLADYKPTDFKSPTISFAVKSTPLPDPLMSVRFANVKIIRDNPPDFSNPVSKATGTLSNELKVPIYVPVDYFPDEKTELPIVHSPLRTQMGWRRWHPEHGTSYDGAYVVSENKYWYKVDAGESVKLLLPDETFVEDGVYCYELVAFVSYTGNVKRFGQLYYVEDPKDKATHAIYSDLFVIDRAGGSPTRPSDAEPP